MSAAVGDVAAAPAAPDSLAEAEPAPGALLEAAPAAFLVLSPGDHRILRVSDAYLAAMRADRAALVGRRLFDILPTLAPGLPDAAAAELRASLDRVALRHAPERMAPVRHLVRPLADEPWREERIWSWVNTPTFDAAGRLTCLMHRAEDVTERERTRLRLTQALQLQRVAERAARLGAWEVDLATRSVTWSDGMRAIHEVPPDGVPALRDVLSFLHGPGRGRLRRAARACMTRGTPFDEEAELVTATGRRRWVRVIGEALRDAEGRVSRISGAVQDLSERRAAEEAHRLLAGRLAATVESITDAFLTLDDDFHVTYANEPATRLLGRSADQLDGRVLWEAAGLPADGPFAAQLHLAAERGERAAFETRLDGAGLWLEVRAYPAGGGLTLVLHDITARRREQQRLRLLEACVARLNDIVLITEAEPIDLPGPRVVFANDAFERITGYTRDEICGQTPRLLQGPGTQRAELDRIRTALANWQPVRTELLNYTKSGREIWLELEIVPVPDEDGWFTHWVAVEREVTERRRHQIQLEQQAALLDQVQDGIIVRGMDQGVQHWNRAAERIYGWTAPEVLGQVMRDRIWCDSAICDLAHATVLAEGHWSGRVEHWRRDRTRVVVDARWTLMRDHEGAPHAILIAVTDVTQQVELEQRLHQAERLKAVGQLTGGVAHDFNNLLTVIAGNAEMLAESLETDPELRLLAGTVLQAAERGAALTSRLLAFSRRQALDPRVTDANALVDGLDRMLRRTLGEHIRIRFRQTPDLSPALVDPAQLETALLNLCLNARDAMPDGGLLTIETADQDLDAGYAAAEDEVAPGRYVMVAVSDTGTGMTPEVVARAFEPFFTTKEVGQGSGLGLSMVFGFMKQSGGHVKIVSQPGQGTTVRLYVPRAAGRSAPAPAPALVPPVGGTERLLVVEDEPMVRDHVTAQLAELGYHVAAAANAAEALAHLRTGAAVDLLVSDVLMPGGMDGPELATAARVLRPGLRVLFTSGYSEQAIHRQARLAPGSLLLGKPYRRRDLAETVRRALEQTAAG